MADMALYCKPSIIRQQDRRRASHICDVGYYNIHDYKVYNRKYDMFM